MVEGGVIAVIRRLEPEAVEEVTFALVEGGITALEVTVDSPNAFETIRKLSRRFQGKALVGAGTVLDGHSAYQAIHSGADFVFSPNLNVETIKTTLRYGKISIPGILTPTEALTAIESGADAVKVFPASSVGLQFIKDIHGPCPHIPIIPTGGVNLENIDSFIKAGAVSVGMGGNLLNKEAIRLGDYEKIRNLASQYVKKVQEARILG